MTIRHHLSEPLLMAYAAGELPEAFALVVATHVSLCDDCRARSEAWEAVGGAVVEDGFAPMGDDALEACLARLDGLEQEPRPVPQPAPRRSVFPAPLAAYVGGDVSAVKWRSLGKGVRQAILPTDRQAAARLLYIPAGVAVPDHGHRGLEMTLVLQGAFSDATGRFARGDVEIADGDLEHVPVAEPGEDCICLAATDAPLRFKAMIPRLAQPFMRI
ncbi:ChrR family anti-sigma-E factor [Pseudogemmobacter blasticus]|uniref:Transcriptional regulator n=1 Tax=Fuscovulum blasticum DSM 2131 TaxID=1188250 RepID=A0A2T4J9I6_FUSBL|nr:ChrR family anti-sigma-E factor [Fuscovulum blasticum]AWD21777.1 transcriptional regulator [Fuscovulum blasticum]PTE14551.1 transcriptional regulator [Fuscovulum blasticum DSM 2131]